LILSIMVVIRVKAPLKGLETIQAPTEKKKKNKTFVKNGQNKERAINSSEFVHYSVLIIAKGVKAYPIRLFRKWEEPLG